MQTSLKILADQQYDELIQNTPMRISDAASMFRRPLSKNDRPYDREVITKNNDLIEEWYKSVLLNIADKQNTVPAGRVSQCLQYFLQGKELIQHQKYKKYLPEYTPEKIMFWIDTFSKLSVSELMDIGYGVVSSGWNVVLMGIKYHFAEEKWKYVYSESSDPCKWDSLANDHPHLMHGRPLPFNLTLEKMSEMEEKIKSILQHPIQPK